MPRNSAEAWNDISDYETNKPYMNATGEPELDDLLNGSSTHAVMASDDVRRDDLIETTRAGLSDRI